MNKAMKILIPICSIILCVTLVILMKEMFSKDTIEPNLDSNGDISIEIMELTGDEIPSGADAKLIVENEWDINILPDEYNTGCDESELTIIDEAGEYGSDNIHFKTVSDKTGMKICLDFAYSNKESKNKVVIENCSFIEMPLVFYNENKVNRDITVSFNNCKFSRITGAPERGKVHYIFNNCTIERFYGSNATFNNCKFGGTCYDAMNVFADVQVNNSYFRDFNYFLAEGNTHSDGVQVYGKNGFTAGNIVFTNCRVEIPAIQNKSNKAAVNACFMVQLEYSDADGIEFNNCKINGGGYSIYAWGKGSCKLSNIKFNDISVGGAKLFGSVYPTVADDVTFDIHDTDSLYVSSVWKDDENKTHIIVSNDTCDERDIRIYYDTDKYIDHHVEACLGGNDLRYFTGELKYSDFPFDREIILDEDCKWIVCYDVTSKDVNTYKQIRCVNWSDDAIYIDDTEDVQEETEKVELVQEEIITEPGVVNDGGSGTQTSVVLSGICGNSIVYLLDEDGKLTLSGEGETYNYHSNNNAPWCDYSSQIKQIVIEEGITVLGDQLFRDCSSATQIILPESLLCIANNVFLRCSSVTDMALPKNLVSIGKYAFASNKALTRVTCDEAQWQRMTIGQYNDSLYSSISLISSEVETPNILSEGSCGENINYILYADGRLILEGFGNMNNYHTQKVAPWTDYNNIITDVNISTGIATLGTQAFINCNGITSIVLPDGLNEIGANAFIRCTSLKSITIPKSLTSIGNYAFAKTAISELYYSGNADDWSKIIIGANNQPLVDYANSLFGINVAE